jgi:ATP-dependent DNA helicase RecG
MTEAEIQDLLTRLVRREQRETLNYEFKAATRVLPEDVWSTVSAFANTGGGWIILGVREDTRKKPVITGVENPDDQVQAFFNDLHNPSRINRRVCAEDDVRIASAGEHKLVVIRVPAVPRKQRPVYLGNHPYGHSGKGVSGTYVRRHTGDFRCSPAEVDQMIREATDNSADGEVLPNFRVDDLDVESVARYRQRFQNRDPASVLNDYDLPRFLSAIGAWRQDRTSGEDGLTVAGLLMLGTEGAIRDWRPAHSIDYRRVNSLTEPATSLAERWEERLLWKGNLFEAYFALEKRLTADLPVRFHLEGSTRAETGPIHLALREALANLLVHADYTETAASLVLRAAEGFRFRNPGSSRVPEAELMQGDHSDPRNPFLVDMFRRIGLVEQAGTGIPKILQAWRSEGLQLPLIDPGTERYEFTLELRYAHLLSDDDRTWLHSLGEQWSEAEQMALVLARHSGHVDNAKLRAITGQHAADVTKVLVSLRDRGFLEMVGRGSTAQYELSPGARSGALQVGGQSPGGAAARPSEITQELWEELLETASPMRESRRMSDTALRDQILVRLCAATPLSLPQLAALVGRTPESLRAPLRDLIAAGQLQYRYPDQLTHPEQAYVATVVE